MHTHQHSRPYRVAYYKSTSHIEGFIHQIQIRFCVISAYPCCIHLELPVLVKLEVRTDLSQIWRQVIIMCVDRVRKWGNWVKWRDSTVVVFRYQLYVTWIKSSGFEWKLQQPTLFNTHRSTPVPQCKKHRLPLLKLRVVQNLQYSHMWEMLWNNCLREMHNGIQCVASIFFGLHALLEFWTAPVYILEQTSQHFNRPALALDLFNDKVCQSRIDLPVGSLILGC